MAQPATKATKKKVKVDPKKISTVMESLGWIIGLLVIIFVVIVLLLRSIGVTSLYPALFIFECICLALVNPTVGRIEMNQSNILLNSFSKKARANFEGLFLQVPGIEHVEYEPDLETSISASVIAETCPTLGIIKEQDSLLSTTTLPGTGTPPVSTGTPLPGTGNPPVNTGIPTGAVLVSRGMVKYSFKILSKINSLEESGDEKERSRSMILYVKNEKTAIEDMIAARGRAMIRSRLTQMSLLDALLASAEELLGIDDFDELAEELRFFILECMVFDVDPDEATILALTADTNAVIIEGIAKKFIALGVDPKIALDFATLMNTQIKMGKQIYQLDLSGLEKLNLPKEALEIIAKIVKKFGKKGGPK